MDRKGLSIKDISTELGIDRSTVSRILNRDFSKHRYSVDTVEKVEEFVAAHGVLRNRLALSLKNSETRIIGMLVANLANPHFAKLAALMNKELLRHDYKMILEDSQGVEASEVADIINDLLSYQVDGLILSLSNNPVFELSRLGKPTVFIDNNVFPDCDYVGLDDFKAADLLTRELKSKGHRKIGLLMDYFCEYRIQGFLRQSGLDFQILSLPESMISQECIEEQFDSHLEAGCTALIGLQNSVTVGAFKYAVKKGLSIPDDIGIAGIDDFELADCLNPAITTVRQPVEKYAAKAVEILLDNIKNKRNSSSTQCLFPGDLRKRNSL